MKNKDLFEIKNVLKKWADKKGEFSYAVHKNIELVDTLIKTFTKLKVIDMTDYKLQKTNICNKYSKGIEDGRYIIEDEENFNKEMDDLDYNLLKTNELLNSECKIIFYKIKKDHLPENLSANDLKEISFMLD